MNNSAEKISPNITAQHNTLRRSFSMSKWTKPIKILLVEDSPLVQYALTTMLHDLGCRFDWAENAEHAIELASQNDDYSLVFMNLGLPDMDGIEATKILRTLDNIQDKPIVAMTADSRVESIERCYAAGMQGFYAKPKTEKDLENIINRHVPRSLETVQA